MRSAGKFDTLKTHFVASNFTMTYDYDLFVFGAGSGGLAAAKHAARYGARVAIAEPRQLGGTCVNRGCIPKKLLVYAAEVSHLMQAATGYGWSHLTPQFDWQRFVAARDAYLQQLQQRQQDALETAGVQIFRAEARLQDAHTIALDNQTITADKILLAVGGKPRKPDIPGSEHALTSDDMFTLKQLPQRLAIVGGGYIGVEFASVLAGLGTEVTLINDSDRILSGFDDDIRLHLETALRERGIQIHANTTATAIAPGAAGLQVTLSDDAIAPLLVEQVLIATGRVPNLDDLGLEAAGVKFDRKAIQVDAHSRTSQPHIFAVGDCTNRLQLTPAAKAEGIAFAEAIFGETPRDVDYGWIPSAVCARPEAASVGQTEAEAREALGDAVQCYRSQFTPLSQVLTPKPASTLLKLVVNRDTDRILGIHMVGTDATEIISSLTLHKHATKQDFDRAIGIHPSTAEEFFSLDE
jgi:glutathione reductase (NADPH)